MTFIATPGILNNARIEVDKKYISFNDARYKFSFEPTNAFTKSSLIRIQFPP